MRVTSYRRKRNIIKIQIVDESKRSDRFWTKIAVVVSAVAVSISAFVAYQSFRHDKLSVKPLISLWWSVEENNLQVGFYIYNPGLGPAVIKKAALFSDGACISTSLTKLKPWEEIESKTNAKIEVKWKELVVKGEAVKPGDIENLFTLTWHNKEDMRNVDLDRLVVIAYCYSSVYDEYSYVDSRIKDLPKKRNLIECK